MSGEVRNVDEECGKLFSGEDIIGGAALLVLYFFHERLKTVRWVHRCVIEANEEFFNGCGLKYFFIDINDDDSPSRYF